MDKDFFFYEDYIRDAQRRRNEALGQLLADAWRGATRLVTRAAHAVVTHRLAPTDLQQR